MTHLKPSTPPSRPRRTAQRATIILLGSLLWAPTFACQPGAPPRPAATPGRQAPPPQAPPPQAPSTPTARLVLVTVRATTAADAQALGASLTSAGFTMDAAYPPVSQGPGLFSLRGGLPEAQFGALSGHPDVAGVHADVIIEPMGPPQGPQSRQPTAAAQCIARSAAHPQCGQQCPIDLPTEGASCQPLYGHCEYTNRTTCFCVGNGNDLTWNCKPS